jgi:hypothetical protein
LPVGRVDVRDGLAFVSDGYREAGFFHGDDVCTADRPFPVRFRHSDLA